MSEQNAAGRGRHGARTDGIVSWVGWHIGELAGVILPGVVAVTVTPWAAVVSVVVGAGWVAHEVRQVRRHAAIPDHRSVRALDAGKSEGDDAERDTAAGWGGGR